MGVIARVGRSGVLLGYFFGPRNLDVPELNEVASLNPRDAALVRRFGHLGLVQGEWPNLGRLEGWERKTWPMPVFVRYEELTRRSFEVVYDPDDPNRVINEELIAPGVAEHGPEDGLLGQGATERVLSSLLSST